MAWDLFWTIIAQVVLAAFIIPIPLGFFLVITTSAMWHKSPKVTQIFKGD